MEKKVFSAQTIDTSNRRSYAGLVARVSGWSALALSAVLGTTYLAAYNEEQTDPVADVRENDPAKNIVSFHEGQSLLGERESMTLDQVSHSDGKVDEGGEIVFQILRFDGRD